MRVSTTPLNFVQTAISSVDDKDANYTIQNISQRDHDAVV
jgi:hypothetical protein